MNYLKAYYKLIETRKNLKRDCYLESHHIVPKSVYGEGILDDSDLDDVNAPENLIELTGREHFVAHWLLYRAFPDVIQFSAGFHAMASLKGKQHKRYTPSSRAVEEARRAYAEHLKDPIAQYDEDGNFIEVYNTTEEAAKKYDTNLSNLSSACNPTNQTNIIRGFQWRRLKNGIPIPKIKPFINQNDENAQKVHMYTSNGNYIKSYDSKREVERDGYERFRSGDELEPQLSKGHWFVISNEAPKNKINVNFKTTQKRPIQQIDKKTGEIIATFSGVREAERKTGVINPQKVANGQRATAGGYKWRYADDETPVDLTPVMKGQENWTEVFKNGESLGVFRSWRQAELKTGISRNFIQKAALRGEWKGITIKKSSNRTT